MTMCASIRRISSIRVQTMAMKLSFDADSFDVTVFTVMDSVADSH